MNRYTLLAIIQFCSYRCTAEYMRLHIGASLSQDSVVYYVGYRYIGGRICSSQDSRTTFFVDSNVITVNYHTDGSNARALRVNYIVRGKISTT